MAYQNQGVVDVFGTGGRPRDQYRIGVSTLPAPEFHTCNISRDAIVLGNFQILEIRDHCSLGTDGETQFFPLSHCLIA
jgi:hypothetical protein